MIGFLDANVLYPDIVRGLLIGAAEAGLYAPRLSPRVAAEWRIVAARERGPDGEASVEARLAAMLARWPDLMVPPDPAVEGALVLPDPADAHVVAAAIAAKASVIITFNLRDFPARRLAAHGLEPRHPDSLLWELSSVEERAMEGVVAAVMERHAVERGRWRQALKKAKLPRTGKLWGGG